MTTSGMTALCLAIFDHHISRTDYRNNKCIVVQPPKQGKIIAELEMRKKHQERATMSKIVKRSGDLVEIVILKFQVS